MGIEPQTLRYLVSTFINSKIRAQYDNKIVPVTESWQNVGDTHSPGEQVLVEEKTAVKSERNFAFIPSLEEGVVDLTIEAEDDLRNKVQ